MEDVTITPVVGGGSKISVTFERKVGLPNYGNVTYRAWVEGELPAAATTADIVGRSEELFAAVKMACLQQAEIAFTIGDDGIVREQFTPAVSVEQAAEKLTRAFPSSTTKWDSDIADDGVRIKGKQHGPIPEWLPAAAAAKGVTEVWDNRDSIAGTKKPHFKSTDTRGIGLWPPR